MWVVDPNECHCPVGRFVVEHLPEVQGHMDEVGGVGVLVEVHLTLDPIFIVKCEATKDARVHFDIVLCPGYEKASGEKKK